MSFYQAKAQFQENFRLIGQEDPEKRNLYGGLLNLVEGMEKLQRDVTDLREELTGTLTQRHRRRNLRRGSAATFRIEAVEG